MRRCRAIPGLLVSALVAAVPVPGAAAQEVSRDDELAHVVRSALVTTGEQSEALLRGLRELNDPTLRPLFGVLAGSWRADLRFHGVLGLAELSPERRVNPLMVVALDSPVEQANLLAEALQRDLIGAEGVQRILAWPIVNPTYEILLRAHYYNETSDVDIDRVEAIAAGSDAQARVLAMVLLSDCADPRESRRAFDVLDTLPDAQRSATAILALNMISSERLRGAAPFVRAVIQATSSERVSLTALRAMLEIFPDEGATLWLTRFHAAERYVDRLQLALLLTGVHSELPVRLPRTLISDGERPLLVALGRAIEAVTTSRDGVEALRDLAAFEHLPSRRWALREAESRPGALFELARVWVLNPVEPEALRERADSLAVQCVSRLASEDASLVRRLLDLALESGRPERAALILKGVLRAGVEPVWERSERAWPDRTCEALALMCEIRAGYKPAPGSEDWQRIQEIALGWGNLDDVNRVQAAWMSLRLMGRHRELLARILSPGAPITE